jgi:hypothetical protein
MDQRAPAAHPPRRMTQLAFPKNGYCWRTPLYWFLTIQTEALRRSDEAECCGWSGGSVVLWSASDDHAFFVQTTTKNILCSQYLRQNRSTCKGFCRFIELLSATTTTPHPQEALDGHCSTFAMPPTRCNEDHATLMQPYCAGYAGHDGACDDVGPVPVDWPRGQ